MKVMCIQDICEDGVKSQLEFGQVYTVYDCPRKGYYIVEGHRTYMGSLTCYAKSIFIPLSEIDKTEYATKELINQPSQLQKV